MEQETPPQKYKVLDGFVKSNLFFKGVYALTFPIGPIFIEALEYRAAQNRIEQHEDKQLNTMQNRMQSRTTDYPVEQALNQNATEMATRFQDMVSPKNSGVASPART